jgi:predicted transcriptional regulator
MALSNELSSEIAAAILAETKTPQELSKLKDVVLQVHSTLQQMSEEARTSRTESKSRALNTFIERPR